jgi:selenocysteine lyase/cysteine desulfurase
VISVSHITFSTGVRVPIARLAELAHKNDALLVVDGAQGPGGIAVDVKALGCDTYATSGHKWLLGPKGTGILYISEAARERIAPMQLDDGLGVYTAIGGTVNLPEVIGLGAVVDWTKRIGREAIFARLMKLRNRLYEELHATPGIRIASPPPLSPLAAHYLCFSVEGQDKHKATADAFAAEKVVVKTVHHGGIDYRIGCHLNNTEADIERFSRVLRKSLT